MFILNYMLQRGLPEAVNFHSLCCLCILESKDLLLRDQNFHSGIFNNLCRDPTNSCTKNIVKKQFKFSLLTDPSLSHTQIHM